MELSIVIVTWNSERDIGPCLDAIEAHAGDVDHEVIVVDNASRDGTVAHLQARGFCLTQDAGPACRHLLVVNAENRGFAAANNQGLMLARAPYVLFLNPDTEIQPGSVQALLAFLREHEDAVAVGPRLTDGKGRVQGGAAGHEFTPWTVLNYSLGLYLLAPAHFPGIWLARQEYAREAPIPVDWVSGAALMTRTDAARSVGGWPEEYFLYIEDIAFCRRLRRVGAIYVLPQAHVIHHIGGSVHQLGQEGLARNVLGLDRDYRTRYPWAVVALLHLIGAVGFGLRWLASALGGRSRVEGHSAPARALWRACTLTSLRCMARAITRRACV